MKTRLAILFIGLFIGYSSLAQPHRLENYRQLLTEKEKRKGFEQDTGYIHLLVKFATCFYEINPDSLLCYAKKANGYAIRIKDEKGEAESLCAIGYFYSLRGDYTQMLSYYQQAQSLAEKINDKDIEANMLRDIGQFYLNTGKEEAALQNFKKAYAMAEEKRDSIEKAYLLVDMAGISLLRHDYDGALQLYRKGMEIVNDPDGYVAAFIRTDIGSVLCDKGQYKEALPYFRVSLQYYLHTNDKLGRLNTLYALANACGSLGQTDTAIACAMESFSLAKAAGNKEGMANAGECLAGLYEKKSDYRSSLEYFKLFKAFSDSLFNEDTRKRTAELEAKFVYDQKEALLKGEHAHQVRILHFEIAIALVSLLLLGILIIFFLYPAWLRQFPHIRDSLKEKPLEEEVYKEKKITYL